MKGLVQLLRRQATAAILAMAAGLLAVGWVFSLALWQISGTGIRSVVCALENEAAQSCALPYQTDRQGLFHFTLGADADSASARTWRIVPDECLESMTVNGEKVQAAFPFCDYGKGASLDLSKYLKPGKNLVTLDVRNGGGLGGLSITTPFSAIPRLLAIIIAAAATALSICIAAIGLRMRADLFLMLAVFLLGSFVRVLYVQVTPYNMRGHDVEGHVEYIQYVADRASLPPRNGGFQFYHPPLYYMLGAPVASVAKAGEWTRLTMLRVLQMQSLGYSLLTLAAGLWAGFLMFGRKRRQLGLFGLALALFPGFIFFAGRINNDALYQLWTFLSLAFLIKAWQKGAMRDWYLSALMLGLGALTKSNALALLPVLGLCFLLKTWRKPKRMFAHGAGLLALIFAVNAWTYVARPADPTDAGGRGMIVGNFRTLTNFVENRPSNYLTFNPVGILSHPYNDPFVDAARRNEFWEYFFRSALTGEFNFGEELKGVVAVMNLLAMVLVLLVFVEMVSDLFKRRWQSLPLTLAMLSLLASHAVFRIVFPYSSSQDFRYSLPLLLPLAYFAARKPEALGRIAEYREALLVLFFLSCTLFLAGVVAG